MNIAVLLTIVLIIVLLCMGFLAVYLLIKPPDIIYPESDWTDYGDAEPMIILFCDHPGCKNHVTHPCEKCGMTAEQRFRAMYLGTWEVDKNLCPSTKDGIHRFDLNTHICKKCGINFKELEKNGNKDHERDKKHWQESEQIRTKSKNFKDQMEKRSQRYKVQ